MRALAIATTRERIAPKWVVHLGIQLGCGLKQRFESGREDAHHRYIINAQPKDASQDLRVCPESSHPESVTEDKRDATVRLLFRGYKIPAELHPHAECVEEVI